MKLHRTIVALMISVGVIVVGSMLAVGCEEWRHAGPVSPNKNNAANSTSAQSQWQTSDGSPTTQPSR